MLKYKVTMPASVLASVLVVSTLIFIGVSLVMLLRNSELMMVWDHQRHAQQKANLISAITRYCQDSTLNTDLRRDTTLRLFPEEDSSWVTIQSCRWGLYEMLEITAGQQRASCLLGKTAESYYKAGLYIPDGQHILSIAGNTCLEGKLYLGKNGISYARIKSEFFNGTSVVPSQIYLSEKEFPVLEPETKTHVRDLFAYPVKALPLSGISGEESFSVPVVYRHIGAEIEEMNLSGRFVLYADDTLYIRGNNRLQGIIVVARKVRISQGFKGRLQIFARDSIVMENSVHLLSGSGLWVNGELPGRSIRLGEECMVEGYVVVMGNSLKQEHPVPHYFQPISSVVKGLVYVDGTAHIKGSIRGCLYARKLCYFASEGYYPDLLYEVTLCRNGEVVYPFLMRGPVERREVR